MLRIGVIDGAKRLTSGTYDEESDFRCLQFAYLLFCADNRNQLFMVQGSVPQQGALFSIAKNQ